MDPLHAQTPSNRVESTPEVADLRRSYGLGGLGGLEAADLAAHWQEQFGRWFDDAVRAEIAEPNAMVLGTAGADGQLGGRTVLLKDFSAEGLTFYTNRGSSKGRALAANPLVSLVFPWFAMERQVTVSGSASAVDDEVSDAYFAVRPRGSQLGAWASPQSQVVADRASLAASLAEVTARFEGAPVPRPPHWGGYLVAPITVEFWQGRPDRMHDRLRFRSDAAGWVVERLAP